MHARYHRALNLNPSCGGILDSDGNAVFVRGKAVAELIAKQEALVQAANARADPAHAVSTAQSMREAANTGHEFSSLS